MRFSIGRKINFWQIICSFCTRFTIAHPTLYVTPSVVLTFPIITSATSLCHQPVPSCGSACRGTPLQAVPSDLARPALTGCRAVVIEVTSQHQCRITYYGGVEICNSGFLFPNGIHVDSWEFTNLTLHLVTIVLQ